MRNILVLIIMLFSFPAMAQIARKPSYYESNNLENTANLKFERDSLSKINLANEFNKLSRIYQANTLFEIPHILFAIDVKNNEVYFINTLKYQLHKPFIEAVFNKNIDEKEFNRNYYNDDRDYMFGTISWQNAIEKYTYEFWEGDTINPKLLNIAQKMINDNFFTTVTFKTNSTLHEKTAKTAQVEYVTQDEIIKEQKVMILNKGEAVGKLVVVSSEKDLEKVGENDIVLLKMTPIWLPPVAGIITEKTSTILSHVNLLSKSWKVPNIYINNAENLFDNLVNKQVKLVVNSNNYTIRASIEKEKQIKTNNLSISKPDVIDYNLRPLNVLYKKDSKFCGAKAANLGEVKNNLKNIVVPDGFCIPFAQYYKFMQDNNIDEILNSFLNNHNFSDRGYRKKELEKIRNKIINSKVDKSVSEEWVKQWKEQLNGQGVFVRSSSNSEDLPNFSGAGLYTTIPNVKTAQQLEEAVKRSWASVFNYEAFEARRVANIPNDVIMMSVLIQKSIDSDSSGVGITKDPFSVRQPKMVSYIAAKKGLGIGVVEGEKIAEQIIYNHRSKAVQILSYSDEASALQLDEKGGVKEVNLTNYKSVVTDDLVINIANKLQEIRVLFDNVHQDIEWAIKDNNVIILQTRPYID